MNSDTTDQFWEMYRRLPRAVRRRAVKAYRLWQRNPEAHGLYFKRIGRTEPIYSARIGEDFRVLGLLEGDKITWYWIGKHDVYDRLLKHL